MKQEAIAGLIAAVRVLAGQVYVSERVAQQVLGSLGGAGEVPRSRIGNLTDRELTVFELIGRGSSTAEMADRLGVSVKTIETHRSNIKTKLNLKDAAELIRFAATWMNRL